MKISDNDRHQLTVITNQLVCSPTTPGEAFEASSVISEHQ
jgi:hypothetical protein